MNWPGRTRISNLLIQSQAGLPASHYSGATSKIIASNPSTIPSSQAQQTDQTDPQSTTIERELAKLADVDRDAVAQHIIALAMMSKKRRQAILTLTEDEM